MQYLPEHADNAATLEVGSDCYPYTITCKQPKNLWVQKDDWVVDDGFDYYSNQKYKYIRNHNAPVEQYSLRKNGRWVLKGDSANGCALYIGFRKHYSDPSF